MLETLSRIRAFGIDEDTGTPINLSYDVPFKFTGYSSPPNHFNSIIA